MEKQEVSEEITDYCIVYTYNGEFHDKKKVPFTPIGNTLIDDIAVDVCFLAMAKEYGLEFGAENCKIIDNSNSWMIETTFIGTELEGWKISNQIFYDNDIKSYCVHVKK